MKEKYAIPKCKLDAYRRNFPDAKIPEEKLDCFALEDGECIALTATWCKYEGCNFYKPKNERKIKSMIYAVDFDGLLCKNAWPEIGEPRINAIEHFKRLKEIGHKLILNTCREGEMLDNAVKWCADHDLAFDAINENLPEVIKKYGGDCRKISADWYADDKIYITP